MTTGESKTGKVDGPLSALHTDLYEITMAAGYFESGRADEIAHFELFVRGNKSRNYYVFCGLESVLDFVGGWRFGDGDVAYLKSVPALAHLTAPFFDYLSRLKFTGDLFAFPEGSIVFLGEPLIRVRAPIVQAQLLETALLAIVNHQTTVATKASRVAAAARGRRIVEFGARRAHGLGAAALGARAAVVGGCAATSNCYAGKLFGLEVAGTLAHSWVMSFEREEEAFEAYAASFPDGLILLIDTYDTLEAARLAAKYAERLKGVRLDSGDLAELSKQVRKILDDGGCAHATIFASGDLNERKIAELIAAGAPIDAFGVGSEMITSRDEPTLGGVYKLVALEDAAGGGITLTRKLSKGKATIPGPKQVYRITGGKGLYERDVIALESEEPLPNSTPLVQKYMENGRRILEIAPAYELREFAASELAKFPSEILDFSGYAEYPVAIGPRLAALVMGGETAIWLPLR